MACQPQTPCPNSPSHLQLRNSHTFVSILPFAAVPSSMDGIIHNQRGKQPQIQHSLDQKLLFQRAPLLQRQTTPLALAIPRNRRIKLSVQCQHPNRREEDGHDKNHQKHPPLLRVFLRAPAASAQNILPGGVDEVCFRGGEEAVLGLVSTLASGSRREAAEAEEACVEERCVGREGVVEE